ncbi:MAG: TVP38/TMEM64 family protein [Candidatus Gastranaerophilales bacterium]|nr:TVP38/TMEM64 family protein [Candidatus Gastranaerophilales bacterium]
MPKHKYLLLFFLISIILVLFSSWAKFGVDFKNIQGFIHQQGILAPLIFILVYTIGPVFFMPITPLSAAAGLLFGPLWGTIYSVIGATSGACATFFVSRYLLKDMITKKTSPKIMYVQDKVEKEGWKFIFIARITPFFPFNLQNYFFGVSKIRFITFLWASALSLIPGAFVYVYIGSAGKAAIAGDTGTIYKIAIAFILLMLISIFPYLIKKMLKSQAFNNK